MGSEYGLHEQLLRRAQKAADAAAQIVAHSRDITWMSTEMRTTGFTTRCAWCSRYQLRHRWVQLPPTGFVFDNKLSHSICDDCLNTLRHAGLSH